MTMSERQIKFIYWFAYYHLDSPSVRYRAKYPLDFAREKLGIESSLIIPGYSAKRLIIFLKSYFSALLFPKAGSIIVIQRVRSNFIYSNLLKLLVKLRKDRTIYDLDDADYLEHNPNIIHYFARNCQYISAGSDEIVNYLCQYNRNVFHITSPIQDLGIVKKEKSETFTIGWIGGFEWGHKDSLYEFVFHAIRSLPFKCTFVLVGVTKSKDEKEIREYFENEGNIHLEIPREIDWNNEIDIQNRIKSFDIGIATLSNHPIQLAKSGIKAKQYMNNGVPVLSTNLMENNKIVKCDYNGFLCNSIEDFRNRMIQFKEMTPKEYAKFSKNARKSISGFDHQKYFKDIENIKSSKQEKQQ